MPGERLGSKQACRVIHQPVSVVSQCAADAWLNGLASGYQRRLTGSGSALEVCSRRCAIQMAAFTLLGHIDENQLHELNRCVAPQASCVYILITCWRRRC